MQLTLIGYILIPISLTLTLLSKKYLYSIFILSIPFSGTVILNYVGRNSIFSLWLFLWLGILWVIKEIKIKEVLSFIKKTPILIFLILFNISSIASLIVPFFFSNTIKIYVWDLEKYAPLTLTWNHFIHLFYISFGILLVSVIAKFNSVENNLFVTIRIYLYSIIFVAIWGIFEWYFNTNNMGFPYFIFNDSLKNQLLDSGRVLKNLGIIRISSVTDEPSILAQTLISGLSFLIVSYLGNNFIISKKIDLISILLIFITLLLSASSSSLIGITTMLFSILFFMKRRIKKKKIIQLWIVLSLCIFIASYYFDFFFNEFLNYEILNKLETDSGIFRLNTIIHAFDVFLISPVIGIGWGSISSFSLLFQLLSSVGIVGTILFFYFFINLQKKMLNIYNDKSSNYSLIAGGVFLSLNSLAFLFLIAGFQYYFLFFWLLIGLAVSVYSLQNKANHIYA